MTMPMIQRAQVGGLSPRYVARGLADMAPEHL